MGNHAENEIEAYLPFWESLTESQKAKIRSEAVQKQPEKAKLSTGEVVTAWDF